MRRNTVSLARDLFSLHSIKRRSRSSYRNSSWIPRDFAAALMAWPTRLTPEAEILELVGPDRVGIPQAFDIDAARQVAFDSCFHKGWSKETQARAF